MYSNKQGCGVIKVNLKWIDFLWKMNLQHFFYHMVSILIKKKEKKEVNNKYKMKKRGFR